MVINSEMKPLKRPDVSDLQEAIQKGLGRAHLWAKQGLWTDKPILLNACLNDLRYDRQCEEARGPWLWQIMEAVGATDEFRDAILDSLLTINDGLAGEQLCQLSVFYARSGDARFRLRLQEIVVRKPDPYFPSLGEKELIDLDGEAGFIFAARVRGESLSSREWDWEDRFFIENAIDKVGESVVLLLLERDSQQSPAMKCLLDGWRVWTDGKAKEPRQAHVDRMRQISVSAAIQKAENERNQAGFLRGWGMYANETDLRTVRNCLFDAQDPSVLANYLQVFSNRPIPEFNERFLAFLDHEDEKVRRRAFSALSQNTHHSIRKFALDNLNGRITEPNLLKLFIRNFLPGDEEALSKALHIPEDVDQCHGFLMDLHKVLEHNLESKCHELARVVYRWTPCGSCRHDATKLLVNRKVAPEWLIEECRHDAIEDTRILAVTDAAE